MGAAKNAYDDAKDSSAVRQYQDIGNNLKKGNIGAAASGIGKAYVDPVNLRTYAKGAMGKDTSKQKAAMKKQDALRQEEADKTRPILDEMKGYDSEYLKRIKALDKETAAQAKDAQITYSNDIQPRLKGIMEEAQRNASSAMTLEEAGDVNNKVQTAVRQLYADQAQGVRKQGLADAGVLAALGNQATANTMGVGGPLTGSQMQLLSANNQQQSGLAFARAQQEMDRLREQGLDRGFSESANQYERGQRAIDRYQGSVANYEGGMDRNIDRMSNFRNQSNAYGGQIHGLKSGGSLRDIGYLNQVYGGKQEGLNQAIAMANADNASKAAMTSGMITAAGTVGGAVLGSAGGPMGTVAGGMVGSQVGSAVGGAATGGGAGAQVPTNNYRPAYGQYGYSQPYQQQQRYGNYA